VAPVLTLTMEMMVNLKHFLLGAGALILQPSDAATSQSVATAPAAQASIEVRKVRKLHYAWANIPLSYQLSIRVPKPFSTANLSASIQCQGIAMTGGYTLQTRNAPAGLIVVGGKVVGKDNNRQDGGFLEVRGASVALRRAKGPRPAPANGVDQIHSQPILIYDGVIDGHFKGGRANRIAIGQYADASLFMVMALNADRNGMSAATLGQFAQDVLDGAPKKVTWLLNFDGGPSAFLYGRNGGTVAPTAGMITSYLCAEPRNG